MRTLIGIGTGIALLAMVSLGSQDLVWAGGGGGGPSCVVTKGKGRMIEGTAAVSTPDPSGGTEAILRLEYRGVEKFFRALTVGVPLSAEHLLCDILLTAVTEDPATSELQTIKQAFGIPDSAQLVLKCEALPDGTFDCSRSIRHASTLGATPGGILSTGLGDVRITVLRPGGHDD